MIAKSKFAGKVQFMGDKLRMDHEVAKGFFQMPIDRMVEKIKQLLDDPVNAGVEAIRMVGGFSDSPLLQDAVRSNFPKLMLVIPPEAGLAVLKGAVIFGHSPQVISQRVSKYTYGIETCIEFDKDEHPEEYMFENND
ncbi:heat shock 70 kDa protein 12A-like [Mya arenaria]|uniref:heat shock 70 kDa protein 12A-like n=1 Tax=Mya arenaria TaxID=6604 RepID=UPI0022E2D073|nr:heat shock 70 kDa protein 12A-like [Mya arenaria]